MLLPCRHSTSYCDSRQLSLSSAQTHPPTCITVCARLMKLNYLKWKYYYCLLHQEDHVFCFCFFLFVPSCQSKEAVITHHTVCYSLSSFVTVLIDRLSFDLSIRNASFYNVANDYQWNACAVSWINKPLNMLVTLALASVRCCSVQSLSIVVWCCPMPVVLKNCWRRGRSDSSVHSSYEPCQRLASPPQISMVK